MKYGNEEIIRRIFSDKGFEIGHERVCDLVRCKDCKHWGNPKSYESENCKICGRTAHTFTVGTDYCSNGERKDSSLLFADIETIIDSTE